MGLIDTHCHLDRASRAGELPALIARAEAAEVEAMIAIGTDTDDWSLNRDLAAGNPGVIHYTVGLHPCNVKAEWSASVAQIESFWAGSQLPKPVAVGEIGLDRFHLSKDPALAAKEIGWQRDAFAEGLRIAKRLACPMVIHSRNAFPECVEMIDKSGVDWTQVVFHCFSEGAREVAELASRGGRASFTGILTYKNAESVREAAKAQGLDRLMVETDAPFLAPAPHRGKTNEPAFVRHTAEYAAQEIFKIPYADLARITTANARQFFGL